MAARINLSAWQSGTSTRYIAFRIGRGAREVTDYFSHFIGCEEYTQARADTQNLVNVTKQYCTEHNLTEEQTEQVKQFVYEQCIEWLENDTPVLLENISTMLDSRLNVEDEGKFVDIAQDDPFFLKQ